MPAFNKSTWQYFALLFTYFPLVVCFCSYLSWILSVWKNERVQIIFKHIILLSLRAINSLGKLSCSRGTTALWSHMAENKHRGSAIPGCLLNVLS